MSSKIVYIPNLVGGQAVQIEMFDEDYSISTSSLSSKGLTLENIESSLTQRRPSTPSSIMSSSSTDSDELPED
jgi:hypothetical protein